MARDGFLPSRDFGLVSPMHSVPSLRRSRREFLIGAGAGSALLAVARLPAFAQSQSESVSSTRASSDRSDDPLAMSATRLAELIRTKKISSTEAVKLCLGRIAAVNGR